MLNRMFYHTTRYEGHRRLDLHQAPFINNDIGSWLPTNAKHLNKQAVCICNAVIYFRSQNDSFINTRKRNGMKNFVELEAEFFSICRRSSVDD